MLSSLPKTFQPALPYNPYQTLYFRRKFIWIQVYLNTSFCLVSHNTLRSVYQIKFQPIFTAPYPSLALASIPIPSSNLVPPPLFHFFQSYQYHIRHSSPHAQIIFLPYMVFECRHNIRNQPVSTTTPSPSSFRDITTTRKHLHFGEILKYVFSYVFQDSLAYS